MLPLSSGNVVLSSHCRDAEITANTNIYKYHLISVIYSFYITPQADNVYNAGYLGYYKSSMNEMIINDKCMLTKHRSFQNKTNRNMQCLRAIKL